MAPHHLSWIASNSTYYQQTPDDLTQGATFQPLEDAIPQHHYHYQHQIFYMPGAFLAQSPTMQYNQSPPPLTFDPSPDQHNSDIEGFELDHDILNNLSYLEGSNFTDYDFDLFPTSQSFIDSPFTEANLFPSLDTSDAPGSVPSSSGHKLRCQLGDCTESFPRQCELTRHEYKHTRPFKCTQCGRAFAEKRRCIQHVQSVHDLATEKDKTKCRLCHYSHVRPDAVKRHLRLKHGVGVYSESSPSTNSGSQSGKEARGRKGVKINM